MSLKEMTKRWEDNHGNNELVCVCDTCHTEIEYYPEDPYPLTDGVCYTCMFGEEGEMDYDR